MYKLFVCTWYIQSAIRFADTVAGILVYHTTLSHYLRTGFTLFVKPNVYLYFGTW